MKTPIFVVSDGSSVAVFRDAERATQSMEAIDVADGVYEAFDSDGLRLDVRVDSDDQSIMIRESQGRAAEPDELRRILGEYLHAVLNARPELVVINDDDFASGHLDHLVAEMQAIEQRFRDRSLTTRVLRQVGAIRRLLGGR